ncbi:hypothetical protein ACFFMR_04110 [Micromonospora andamanensis]|uniref:hypothetical protein n=1 Tax=Micromonospora andamanensis TaxID=1287068 RepID=UPI001EF3A807|nr:hypothetical protein [Micromonospora andamanensis]
MPTIPWPQPAVTAERAARALARLRGTRLLHPAGRSFTGEVLVRGTSGPPTGVRLVDRPGRYPATIRFSKGSPTPGGWPDVLGLAVRIHRPTGRPFDLLVSSSTAAPGLRHLPLPRRRFTGTYSSIMSYRTGRRRLWLAALADPESPDLGHDLAGLATAVATERAGRRARSVRRLDGVDGLIRGTPLQHGVGGGVLIGLPGVGLGEDRVGLGPRVITAHGRLLR